MEINRLIGHIVITALECVCVGACVFLKLTNEVLVIETEHP